RKATGNAARLMLRVLQDVAVVEAACIAKGMRVTPSPLNGERVGVRGENARQRAHKYYSAMQRYSNSEGCLKRLTPHPQSLSPLRGEGSPTGSVVLYSVQ